MRNKSYFLAFVLVPYSLSHPLFLVLIYCSVWWLDILVFLCTEERRMPGFIEVILLIIWDRFVCWVRKIFLANVIWWQLHLKQYEMHMTKSATWLTGFFFLVSYFKVGTCSISMSNQNHHKEYLCILTYYENNVTGLMLWENLAVANCRSVKCVKRKK